MAEQRKREYERRNVERVSNPHMREHLKQIRWSLLALTVLIGGAALYHFATINGSAGIGYGVFMGVTFLFLAILIWRYYKSILLFVENESANNLDSAMERQSTLWIAIAFLLVVYMASQLFFLKN
jgi:hypothetical protein